MYYNPRRKVVTRKRQQTGESLLLHLHRATRASQVIHLDIAQFNTGWRQGFRRRFHTIKYLLYRLPRLFMFRPRQPVPEVSIMIITLAIGTCQPPNKSSRPALTADLRQTLFKNYYPRTQASWASSMFICFCSPRSQKRHRLYRKCENVEKINDKNKL